MVYDIRPLSFGEILDRSFRVYIDNFMLLFGISALIWIPSGIIMASAGLVGNTAASVLNLLFLVVVAPLAQAALTVGIAEAYLGRPIDITEAFQSVRNILLPIIGTYFLMGLVFAIPGVILGVLTYLLSPKVFGVEIVLFVFVALYFAVGFALIGPVMIVERHFGFTALRRSRALVAGSWWLTLGILITASLIGNVPAAALRFVWGFIPIIGVILTAATQAVSSAYGMIAAVIYYFDRRCRTEDFDLRLLAEQIRSQSGPAPATAPGSSSLA